MPPNQKLQNVLNGLSLVVTNTSTRPPGSSEIVFFEDPENPKGAVLVRGLDDGAQLKRVLNAIGIAFSEVPKNEVGKFRIRTNLYEMVPSLYNAIPFSIRLNCHVCDFTVMLPGEEKAYPI